MIVTDLEFGKMLKSEYFNPKDQALAKRRIRALAKKAGISPIDKSEEIWLYRESDVYKVLNLSCLSKSQKEKAHRTGKSAAQYRESASARVLARL